MQDYIFSILTGYVDTPAGVELDEGQTYNPYMNGGKIAMAQQLWPDSVEFDDGERWFRLGSRTVVFLRCVVSLVELSFVRRYPHSRSSSGG